jgi:hypothetical protein
MYLLHAEAYSLLRRGVVLSSRYFTIFRIGEMPPSSGQNTVSSTLRRCVSPKLNYFPASRRHNFPVIPRNIIK